MLTGETSLRTVAVALAACALFALAVTAAPPPPQSQRQVVGSPSTAPAALHLPDIAVTNAWIGPGDPPPNLQALLGRNPWVGEMITLGCEITITGQVPANTFTVSWWVDGVKTCGEGTWQLQDPPLCEYTWPFATGTQVALTYVPHTAGPHVYSCKADTGKQVAEFPESNNHRDVPFTAAMKPQALGPVNLKLVPKSALGPKLKHP